MDDKVAFTLGTRYFYNRALWQMLGSPSTWFHDVKFPIFHLPMQSGVGFILIHIWAECWEYGKARYGGLHTYAEECGNTVRKYYE